jgi:predicted dehydrogenase
MQLGDHSVVTAIASRDMEKACEAAERLGVAKAYGSYEELIADPDIDAVYNPLPNHLHVPWSIRCLESGKHILCEKPIALSVAETFELIRARDRTGLKAGEAFMARTHPQWLRVQELVRSGAIGDLRLISGFFSYFNRDPANVRNVADWGGGGVMDIGCYPITLSRMIFGEEPRRVSTLVDRDPDMGVDRLASAILDYPSGQCSFSCSMQLVPYQRMHIFGTRGRIEVEIPFNAPPDHRAKLFIDDGTDILGGGIRMEEMPACNQYTIQGDLFSRAILDNSAVPVPLEDALRNMAVIEAVLRAGASGRWEFPISLNRQAQVESASSSLV